MPDDNSDIDILRQPPCDVLAEKAFLGAIFINNRAYENVSEFLKPEHFALSIHGRIYEASARLIDRGQAADTVTLKHALGQDESLDEIGGIRYLVDLADSAVTVINAVEYGRLIFDLYRKREIIALGGDIINRAHAGGIDETAETLLADLALGASRMLQEAPETVAAEDSLDEALRDIEAAFKDGKPQGQPTGFTALDRRLGGLIPGNLYILAGRPGMGKTAMAVCVAEKFAAGGVLFQSLEMTDKEIQRRRLSRESGIGATKLRDGDLSSTEFDRVIAKHQMLKQSRFHVDGRPKATCAAIRRNALRYKGRGGLALVVVDHIGRVQPDDPRAPRYQQLGQITWDLKSMAKELDVPVLALSQLNRQVENREDKRPTLGDLRESGNIEEDADVILMLYREAYYLAKNPPRMEASETEAKFTERCADHETKLARCLNHADLIIAKHRDGPEGTAELHFDPGIMRFGNLDGGAV